MNIVALQIIFAAVQAEIASQMEKEGSGEGAVSWIVGDMELVGSAGGFPEGDRPYILTRPDEVFLCHVDEVGELHMVPQLDFFEAFEN